MTETQPPSQDRIATLRQQGKTSLSRAALSLLAAASLIVSLYAGGSSLREAATEWRSVVTSDGAGGMSELSLSTLGESVQGSGIGWYLLMPLLVASGVVMVYGLSVTRFLFRVQRASRARRREPLSGSLVALILTLVSGIAMTAIGIFGASWLSAPADRLLELPPLLGKVLSIVAIPALLASALAAHFLGRWSFLQRYRMSKRDAESELRDGA